MNIIVNMSDVSNVSMVDYLKAVGLTKYYGRRRVLDGLSIEVKKGEVVGLLGPNGAGKSTTFLIISGFIKSNSGRVLLDGVDITKMKPHQRARLGIIYLPQNPSLFPELTVYDNLLIVCQAQGLGKSESRSSIESVSERFGIRYLLKNRTSTLSGGERRKVEIGRIFLLKPSFVLLDEPFSGIEPRMVERISEMIDELKKDNVGAIVSDHNVRDTLRICSKIYLIYEGKIVETGGIEEVVSSSYARSIFFGERFEL